MREGGFGEWDSSVPGQATIGWTSTDVFRFITKRMQLLSDSRTMDSRLSAGSWPETALEKRLRPASKQPLATKWGLDNLHRWKLSQEFADAYPFLDCANGECSPYSYPTEPTIMNDTNSPHSDGIISFVLIEDGARVVTYMTEQLHDKRDLL
jgi:hypothetical protein